MLFIGPVLLSYLYHTVLSIPQSVWRESGSVLMLVIDPCLVLLLLGEDDSGSTTPEAEARRSQAAVQQRL